MPNKPDLLQQILSFINDNPTIIAFGWAMVFSFLRIFHSDEKKTTRQTVAEMLFCGALSVLALKILIFFFSIDPEWGAGIGGAIGFFGVEKIKLIADKVIDKKIGGNDDY